MILGDTCTRACAFCNVKTGMPGPVDKLEPLHVAEAAGALRITPSRLSPAISTPLSTVTASS